MPTRPHLHIASHTAEFSIYWHAAAAYGWPPSRAWLFMIWDIVESTDNHTKHSCMVTAETSTHLDKIYLGHCCARWSTLTVKLLFENLVCVIRQFISRDAALRCEQDTAWQSPPRNLQVYARLNSVPLAETARACWSCQLECHRRSYAQNLTVYCLAMVQWQAKFWNVMKFEPCQLV